MAKRPTRLRFTEDDLSSDAVKKAAGKAEKAAAKAEKAVDKITPKKHRKLRQEADVSASRTAKLRFGKAKADDIPPKPSGIKRTVTHAPVQEVRSVGFPAETAELAEKLNDSQFRAGLKAEYQNFLQAHNEDSSLLRFHYHKLERLAQRLDELDLPLREYQSSMTMPPLVRQFITDDEINESLSGGSGFSGGKARIYEYWQKGHSAKEKADFLKNEYGTGGRSHALSGASGSGEDHDAKGIRCRKLLKLRIISAARLRSNFRN